MFLPFSEPIGKHLKNIVDDKSDNCNPHGDWLFSPVNPLILWVLKLFGLFQFPQYKHFKSVTS